LETRRVVALLGKAENVRPLQIALFQGSSRKNKASVTLELEAADNPILEGARPDPTLFCTAAKKNRWVFRFFTHSYFCWIFISNILPPYITTLLSN